MMIQIKTLLERGKYTESNDESCKGEPVSNSRDWFDQRDVLLKSNNQQFRLRNITALRRSTRHENRQLKFGIQL